MSNFTCEICGAPCIDTPRGYITGCVHYPPDAKPTRADLGLSPEQCIILDSMFGKPGEDKQLTEVQTLSLEEACKRPPVKVKTRKLPSRKSK